MSDLLVFLCLAGLLWIAAKRLGKSAVSPSLFALVGGSMTVAQLLALVIRLNHSRRELRERGERRAGDE